MVRVKQFLIIILCVMVISTGSIAAQTQTPRDDAMNAALSAMSQYVGRTITLRDVSNWAWNFGPYSYVVGLGCAAAPATATAAGDWQRFEFTFNGAVYVYIVSNDLQTVILCNPDSAPAGVASPVPTALPANTAIPPATVTTPPGAVTPVGATGGNQSGDDLSACPLAPRLAIGQRGRVTPGDANWVYVNPTRAAEKIGEIPGLSEFMVLDGPVCDAFTGVIWWNVLFDGNLRGWTEEGDDGEYWLFPLTNTRINIQTITTIAPLTTVLSQYPDGIVNYVFMRDRGLIAVLDTAGVVSLWDVRSGLAQPQRVGDLFHNGPVNWIGYSEATGFLLTINTERIITIWNPVQLPPVSMLMYGHPTTVTSVALGGFVGSREAPLGYVLAAGTPDGQVLLWRWDSLNNQLTPLQTLDVTLAPGTPVTSLVFDDDEFTLTARAEDGRVLGIWYIAP